MKKIFISFAVVFSMAITIVSCSKVEDLVDNISVPVPFTVPASVTTDIPVIIADTVNTITYPEIPLNLDLDAAIKDEFPSMSINNLKSVKLSAFSIQLLSSSNENQLDIISDASLLIKAPGVTERVIATAIGNTSKSALTFTPVTTDPDLKLLDYLKTNQNSIILKIKGAKAAEAVMKLKFDAAFKLEVGL